MVPSASWPATQAATSRDEEIARRAFCAGFPVPRWCASVRLTMSSNRSRARVALCAVALSGLRPSRAVFSRRRPLPTVPVRALLTVPLRATSSKHSPRGPEADVGSGDESPREMSRSYASRQSLSSDRGRRSWTAIMDDACHRRPPVETLRRGNTAPGPSRYGSSPWVTIPPSLANRQQFDALCRSCRIAPRNTFLLEAYCLDRRSDYGPPSSRSDSDAGTVLRR